MKLFSTGRCGWVAVFIVAGCLASGQKAHAFPSLNYNTMQDMTNQAVDDTIRMVGIGADHRPYQSATPLGLIIGMDLGVDVTLVSVPQSFRNAMALAGNTEGIPALVPVPRFNLRKGLPFGIDAGMSFIVFEEARIIGGDLQYALASSGPFSTAVRGAYNYAKVWYIETTTWSFDLVGSLKIPLLAEPYAGFGWQMGSGNLTVPSGLLPATVSGSSDYSNARFFVGLPITLLPLLHVTAEYGYSFGSIYTYGAKVSLAL